MLRKAHGCFEYRRPDSNDMIDNVLKAHNAFGCKLIQRFCSVFHHGIKQAFDQRLTVFQRNGTNPAIKSFVQIGAGRVGTIEQIQTIRSNAPGHHIMLHNGTLCTLNDASVGDLGKEQLSDDRISRNNTCADAVDILDATDIQNFRTESGTIKEKGSLYMLSVIFG